MKELKLKMEQKDQQMQKYMEFAEKQMGDKGYNIQIDNVEEAMERGKVDITTIKTMINQPGPIMEKIYSKNAN